MSPPNAKLKFLELLKYAEELACSCLDDPSEVLEAIHHVREQTVISAPLRTPIIDIDPLQEKSRLQ